MRRTAVLAMLLVGLAACDPFPSVQKEGTIEAYEAYLKEHPDSTYGMQAKTELEQLYLAEARANPSLETYDRYLDRWPQGVSRDEALKERMQFLYDWAEKEMSADGWQRFLDEYPNADKKIKKDARAYLKVAKYIDQLDIAAPRLEQVNLAENPEGPLDGWGIFVDVTNKGDQTIELLSLTVFYLDAEGHRLGKDEFPLVAPDFGIPMEEEKKVPMKPGETRTWVWTTGDMPPNWGKKVEVHPSALHFLDPRKLK